MNLYFSGDVQIGSNDLYNVLATKQENGKSLIRLRTESTASTNDILQHLLNSGSIVSFNPALPSMNEIFIRVVEASN